MIFPVRNALAGAAAGLFAWGAIVAATGGVDARVLGIVVRSRDPLRPLAAGLVAVALLAVFFRRDVTRGAERAAAIARAYARLVTLLLAGVVAAHGIVFGTFSVGGSDAYGYVNQAYDWIDGGMPRPIPLGARLPFAASDRLQAPLGYREGQQAQTIVPTYAPGLPLVMALALAVAGACGPFLVTPLAAAAFVWLTFELGTRTGGASTGLLAAVVVSLSPIVLYQTLWPMSDIASGAVWTGAVVLSLGTRTRHAALAGLVTAIALLVRPNLVPVAVVPALALASRGSTRDRSVRLIWFGAPVLGALAFAAWLNLLWYGSPLNSGYGAAGELYERANVLPNLRLYAGWLWESQSPLMLLALLPLTPWFRRGFDSRAVASCAALLAVVAACYLAYAQFEIWWYLRFFLPAFGGLAVLVAAGLLSALRSVPRPFGHLGGVLALSLFAWSCLSFASREGVFGRVRDSESRYAAIGSFAATLPDRAALIAAQHAGSLRFHTGRPVLRFDVLEYPQSLELVAALERAARHPFLIADDAEMPEVRRRYGIPVDAPLPWPIHARMRELGGVTIYDLGAAPSSPGPVALEPPLRQSWCDAQPRAAQRW
jgi:hypothetical protein